MPCRRIARRRCGTGQFLQDLTLGSSVSFELSFTTNYSGIVGSTPDRLVLSLLDPDTNRTLVDTDLDLALDPLPFQDALLFVDLAGDARIQVASRSHPGVPITIPEPGAAALFSLGLALLGGQGIRRRTASVSGGKKPQQRAADRHRSSSLQTTTGEETWNHSL